MVLVEVAFKGNRKEFYAWEGEQPPPLRASIVVEADRGEDLGVVHAVGEQAQKRCVGCSHGLGSADPTRKALRVASTREVRQARDVRSQDEVARQKAATLVKTHGLAMKVSDAEWQWDRKKLTFYFTADKRVDFRDLVRDLAAMFRARIELKQIGVRDEAKRLDGVGRCGRQFCSASWLPELRPVNLGVAKDQHLSLNPSQISGACGRLMCCLRYEHEMYVEARKRFPKEGKTLVTGKGEEKVVSNEIFSERVTLRSAEGETRVISLAQLRRELAASGQPAPGTNGSTTDGSPTSLADSSELESDLGGEVTEVFEIEGFEFEGEEAAEVEQPERKDKQSNGQAVHGKAPSGVERREPGKDPRSRAALRRDHAPPDPTPGATSVPPPAAPPTLASGEPGQPSTAGTVSEERPREGGPRRRRGRRGGRRGRGKGGGGTKAPPGSESQGSGNGANGPTTPQEPPSSGTS